MLCVRGEEGVEREDGGGGCKEGYGVERGVDEGMEGFGGGGGVEGVVILQTRDISGFFIGIFKFLRMLIL
jgi:hypothetical protein